MAEDFPRLLIATEFPPNASGGGPAVVRQMLKGWPVKKLSWWSCLPESDQRFGQKVAAHSVALIPNKFYPHNRWRAPKSWLRENVWTPWAARHFRHTLRRQKPEVIWVVPHGWSILPLATALPAAKIGFHVTMQDYMDIDSYITRYGIARSRRMAVQADWLFAQATTRDATSHPMIADLLTRTGASAAQMLHAGIESEDFDCLQKEISGNSDTIRIAHAGSIQLEDVFALFVAALKQIRRELPLRVTLEFYGNHSYRNRAWFDASWMAEHGNLPATQLTEELKKCTWGFSPMALTDRDPRYNHFSFPTKFISYLAAGLPVITLGHPESSVVKMATAYKVGICITTSDVKQIGAQLTVALAEPDPKSKYRAVIQQCALTEFDACRMRKLLHGCFLKCAAVTRNAEPIDTVT